MNLRFKKCYDFIIDLIFPNRCPCCDKFISYNKLMCDECESKCKELGADVCPHCGKSECICDKQNLYYDRCFVSALYDGIVKHGIYNLKYKKSLNIAKYYAQDLCKQIIDGNFNESIDAVTYVPMSRESLSERGYNQAEIIASEISLILNKPIVKDLLLKKYNNVNQHRLTASERKEAVKGLYCINQSKIIKNMNILICDDIITTSSTLNECAMIIKGNGAKRVFCACIATTMLKNKNNKNTCNNL